MAVSDEVVGAIAARHGLRVGRARVLQSGGIINTVFALDDQFVLRVPRDHPAHIAQAKVEAEAIPLAVAAGVRTPSLVAFDDSLEHLPVPYLIVEQVQGRNIEAVTADPAQLGELWIEVGRDLGRLHAGVDPARWPGSDTSHEPASRSNLVTETPQDPRLLVQRRVDDGWLSYLEGRWFEAWLDRLGDLPTGPVRVVATHGDVQMSNIIVDPGTNRYRALLDWGCAARKDGVVDFMAVPFVAVPYLLGGHREITPLDDDEHAERRIVSGRIHTLLSVLPRGAAPGTSWGERPIAWLADLLRFFQQPPNDRWRLVAPLS